MDNVMPASIGVIRKIQELDFELDPELLPERLHPILCRTESIRSAVRDIRDCAVLAAPQLVRQRLIMPACCKCRRIPCVKIIEC